MAELGVQEASADQLAALRSALTEACRRLSKGGDSISLVIGVFAPSRRRCFCLFSASSRDLVRSASEIAQAFPVHIEAVSVLA